MLGSPRTREREREERAMWVSGQRSPALRELIDREREVEQLGTGFTFTEGPIWNPRGQYLLFSDMPGDMRRRWDEQDGVDARSRSPSNKGNGMTLDPRAPDRLRARHELASCAMDPDGTGGGREVLATHYEGKELNSPNDVVVALQRHDLLQRPDLRADARLRHRARAGARLPGRLPDPAGRRRAELLVDDFGQPNGLCFSPTSRCSTSTTPTTRTSASSTSPATARSRTAVCSPRASARRLERASSSTG